MCINTGNILSNSITSRELQFLLRMVRYFSGCNKGRAVLAASKFRTAPVQLCFHVTMTIHNLPLFLFSNFLYSSLLIVLLRVIFIIKAKLKRTEILIRQNMFAPYCIQKVNCNAIFFQTFLVVKKRG